MNNIILVGHELLALQNMAKRILQVPISRLDSI